STPSAFRAGFSISRTSPPWKRSSGGHSSRKRGVDSRIPEFAPMPIAIACKACGIKYNVPDHMAGRSAKCKCGSAIAVPARAGPARATAAAPGPAPARQAVAPPAAEEEIQIGEGDVVETAAPPSSLGSFSLDSLNDQGVPPKMQTKIREEIKPTEKVLWVG